MDLNKKQKFWDEYFDEKQLSNQIKKESYNPYQNNETHQRFLKESRLQLFEDALNKTKFNSPEFNALLDECINLFIDLNENKNLDKQDIIKFAKDNFLKDEIVGEFDGKKSKSTESWPYQGRITLRDAIDKKSIGQNPKAEKSKNVETIFGSEESYNYPSPSNTSVRSVK